MKSFESLIENNQELFFSRIIKVENYDASGWMASKDEYVTDIKICFSKTNRKTKIKIGTSPEIIVNNVTKTDINRYSGQCDGNLVFIFELGTELVLVFKDEDSQTKAVWIIEKQP